MKASAAIAQVSAPLLGMPVFIAGSAVAEETYGITDAHDDIDLFTPSEQALFIVVQRLLDNGYNLVERHDRVWERWQQYGFKHWHTNSLRLLAPGTPGNQIKVNVVYKLVDKHPTTSVSQVVESFDFGLLASGYDLKTGTKHDFRAGLFPGLDPDGPLPLMPNKRANWRGGFISQYNGLREALRYAKYLNYGYDLSLVKTDLVEGWYNAASYLTQRDDPDKQLLGRIYESLAGKVEADDIDAITAVGGELLHMDELDAIMDALE